jgi:addiction module HigA family antidote
MTDMLPNPHPGEILLEEFLKPAGISSTVLARAVHMPARQMEEIIKGWRAVTPETDRRLARYFGVAEGFFLGLQADHDLMSRERKRELRLPTSRRSRK